MSHLLTSQGPAELQKTVLKILCFKSFYSLHHPAALLVLMYIYLCVLMSFCLCVCVRGSVLDVNDETPTFNPRVYNVSLKESVPRDHIVARLSCSDNDAGLNAELSYFITGQRSQWELFSCVCGLLCCTAMGTMCTYGTFVHPSVSVCVCVWGQLLLHASFIAVLYVCQCFTNMP